MADLTTCAVCEQRVEEGSMCPSGIPCPVCLVEPHQACVTSPTDEIVILSYRNAAMHKARFRAAKTLDEAMSRGGAL